MKKVLYITILACSTFYGDLAQRKINNPPEQIPL